MNCEEALPLMHAYLDGDLELTLAARLQIHVRGCAECRKLLQQWERTEAVARMQPRPEVPADLTSRIMSALPRPTRRRKLMERVKRHPALTTAAAFVLIMFAALMSTWNENSGLVVQGQDLDHIVINGDTVVVPKGEKLAGDLTVEHGKVQVDGEVQGNVTVIDGSLQMASSAYVSGQVEQIDQSIDWIIFEVRKWLSSLSLSPAP